MSSIVLVLGDVGRSPRMRNHAVSLAEEQMDVQIVGYAGSKLPERVANNSKIRVTYLTPFPETLRSLLPRLFLYALKVIWQTVTILLALPWMTPANFLFLQNPPSIPTMAVCHWYCKWLTYGRTKLVIDWHNYGYTILAMGYEGNQRHPIVRLSKAIERSYGPCSQANFCVTEAMRRDLHDNWGVIANTLYDKAPEQFQDISLHEKHKLFLKLARDYDAFKSKLDEPNSTRFTRDDAQSGIEWIQEGAPKLLVSSTSWTEDEDFSILLEALENYENAREADASRYPELVCAITGKGPLKSHYAARISAMEWRHVTIVLPWLDPDDYPRLLACADLGVSLHTSSSGLDLPMKVVDMFGCGLPVAAMAFTALPELVRDGENGMVFSNASELSEQLQEWFGGLRDKDRYRQELRQFQAVRWREYWKRVVLPVLRDLNS